MTGTVYGWLVAQGLWPTALGGLLYWAIPITAAAVLSRKTLRKVWAEVEKFRVLLNEHNRLAEQHTRELERLTTHLATIADHQTTTARRRATTKRAAA